MISSRPAPFARSRWSRARGVGAVCTAAVFLGTTVLAPFSVAQAFDSADPAGSADPATSDAAGAQIFTAAVADAAVLDLRVAAADREPEKPTRGSAKSRAEYTLAEFMFTGAVNWNGYRFTFYSQQVLPGPGLEIPGRHVNADGYVADDEGFIVLAGDAPKGTVYDTPFGAKGKIYDRGTFGNHLDVYIR